MLNTLTSLEYFDEVNGFRSENELNTIQLDLGNCSLAYLRLFEIQKNFSHAGFRSRAEDGSYLKYCDNCTVMGENLAKDLYTPSSTMAAWYGSINHRRLLEGDYDFGCLAHSGGYSVLIVSKE